MRSSKSTEARLGEFQERDRAGAAETLVNSAEEIGGAKLVSGRVDGLGGDGLRSLAFQVRDCITSGIGVLGSVADGKAALIVVVTDDLAAKDISAGEIAALGAKVLGGGASSDAKLAQAGGPHIGEIDGGLAAAVTSARTALTSL